MKIFLRPWEEFMIGTKIEYSDWDKTVTVSTSISVATWKIEKSLATVIAWV